MIFSKLLWRTWPLKILLSSDKNSWIKFSFMSAILLAWYPSQMMHFLKCVFLKFIFNNMSSKDVFLTICLLKVHFSKRSIWTSFFYIQLNTWFTNTNTWLYTSMNGNYIIHMVFSNTPPTLRRGKIIATSMLLE